MSFSSYSSDMKECNSRKLSIISNWFLIKTTQRYKLSHTQLQQIKIQSIIHLLQNLCFRSLPSSSLITLIISPFPKDLPIKNVDRDHNKEHLTGTPIENLCNCFQHELSILQTIRCSPSSSENSARQPYIAHIPEEVTRCQALDLQNLECIIIMNHILVSRVTLYRTSNMEKYANIGFFLTTMFKSIQQI